MTTTTVLESETRAEPEVAQPFSRQELRGMLGAPLRMVDLLLGERRRLAANLAQEHRLPSLLLVLTLATAVLAVPFGAVLGLARVWRVAALLLGGVAICVPSLHVFGRYLGARLSWAQTLGVSLAATAVTSLFTLAFTPIVAFWRATMTASAGITWQGMSTVLLACAFLLGVGQLVRLLRGEGALRVLGPSLGIVLIPWLVFYALISVRLATVLFGG
jgi:hypothetical protein